MAQQETNDKDSSKHVWFANQIPDFACATVALLNIVNNIKGLQMGKELRDFRDFTNEMDPMSRGDAIDSFDFVKHIHNSFARENDLLIADMHVKQKAAKAKKRQALAKAKETRQAKLDGKTPLQEKSVNATSTPIRSSNRFIKKSAKITGCSKSASASSSPLSSPPGSDPEFDTPSKTKKANGKPAQPIRKSERKPKPRQSDFAASAAATAAEDEEGFHFIAYMPIDGHVWKLDGLDSFPQDIGTFDAADGGDWMNITQPMLQTRMAMYEGAEIEFNLMAVVHDPIVKDRERLVRNVKEIQVIEKKLDEVVEDWREMDGAETKKEIITGPSVDFDVSQADVDAIELTTPEREHIEKTEGLMELVDLRKVIMCRQAPLRAAIRDGMESSKEDDEKARHRRHDYSTFVRSWLGELAEHELLSGLLDGS